MSRKEELQALVDATRAKWGGIDIVVANAAANPYYGPLTGISDEAFDKIVDEQREERALARGDDAARHGAARKRPERQAASSSSARSAGCSPIP